MELPDTRQLRAFILLAETRSFTAAAKRMFVTQSAISHSIKALETSLECSLFDRSGKKVALTSHGELFLGRVKAAVGELEQGVDDLASLNRWGHGKLRLAATNTVCQYLLPAVLREFRESFPNCEIAITPGDSTELVDEILEGTVDMAIGLRTDTHDPSILFVPLFKDQLAFVASPLHPLVTESRNGALTTTELATTRFIIYSRSSYTFRIIDSYFRREGTRSPSLLELGNMEAIKEMAKIGLGVGVVAPWVALRELDEGSLRVRTVPEKSLQRQWGLFHHRSRELSLIEETFAGICETVARNFAVKAASRTMSVDPR
jgi:DNA-binding transcriptional LysR family regulator